MVYLKKVPGFIRLLLPPNLTWEIETNEKIVYLTFDDGPVPEVTPWVLETLKHYGVKATFFCVGDNIRKNPHIFQSLLEEGHKVGNHTFNHLKGWKVPAKDYLENVEQCNMLAHSNLFRPPHGQISNKQAKILGGKYSIIMWSLLSGDFDPKSSPETCLKYLSKRTKEGSIVVFHDSIKAFLLLKPVLPAYLEFCLGKGFEFRTI